VITVRSTDPTPAEAEALAALGRSATDYCAMPVGMELFQQAGAQIMRAPLPDGSVQEVLVTTWTVGIDLGLFKPIPGRGLALPDQGVAAQALKDVMPAMAGYWLVPRESLSQAGLDLLVVWNHQAEPPAFRLGFNWRQAAEDPDPDELPVGMFPGLDEAGGLALFTEAEHGLDYWRGVEAARALEGAEGWDRVVWLRSAAVQGETSQAEQAPLASGAGQQVGTCPECGVGTTERYCTGSVARPHRQRRVRQEVM